MEVLKENIDSSTKARRTWLNKDYRFLGNKNEVVNGGAGSNQQCLCVPEVSQVFRFPGQTTADISSYPHAPYVGHQQFKVHGFYPAGGDISLIK